MHVLHHGIDWRVFLIHFSTLKSFSKISTKLYMKHLHKKNTVIERYVD